LSGITTFSRKRAVLAAPTHRYFTAAAVSQLPQASNIVSNISSNSAAIRAVAFAPRRRSALVGGCGPALCSRRNDRREAGQTPAAEEIMARAPGARQAGGNVVAAFRHG
jgi:hypothetical protein